MYDPIAAYYQERMPSALGREAPLLEAERERILASTREKQPQAGDEVGGNIFTRAYETARAAELDELQVSEAGIGWPMLVGAGLSAIGAVISPIDVLPPTFGTSTVPGGRPVPTVYAGTPGTEVVPIGEGGAIVGGVPTSGPGVPEPPRSMVAKQWKIKAFSKTVGEYWVYFFKLIDGRIMCWNAAKREWKIWRPKKNLVLSANPRLKDLTKLDRIYTRMTKMVRKFAPKPKQVTRQVASKYLSAAERKLLNA